MTLEQLKLHMRVTSSFEDELIEMYKSMAEEEIKSSVCTDENRDESFFEDNILFDKAVFLLASYYYEQRFAYGDDAVNLMPFGVIGTIQKLRGNYPYES